MEAQGTQNIKDIVVAGCKVYKAVHEAKVNDGKIDLADAHLLMPVIPALIDAIKDAKLVVPEFKDLSTEEAAELISAVKGEISGTDEEVTKKVLYVLLALKANYEAVRAFV